MMTLRGVAKLSDFGISKQLESTAAFAMTQVGTILYMAPERFSGGTYTLVSDVWSMGIITIEALTGTHPYEGKNFISISMAVSKNPSPTPPEGTPPEVAEVRAPHAPPTASSRPPLKPPPDRRAAAERLIACRLASHSLRASA